VARPRKIALRRHKGTGVHYTTLPDGSFKYFSKDPTTAEKEFATWLVERQNPSPQPSAGDSISQPPTGGNKRLMTVRDICNAYLAFLKGNRGPRHYEDMKASLQEFCDKCVSAGTPLTQLSKAHFLAWRELVHQKVEKGEKSAFWANKRTRAVKAAFRRAMKDYDLSISKAQLDEFLFTLYQVPEPMSDDIPYTPQEVQALRAQAGTQMQAMILLALNGCLDNVDIARLTWESIDLDRKEANYPRKKPSWKTTRPRRFRLWERTVEALRQLPSYRSGRQGKVFATKFGQDWVRVEKNAIAQEFPKLKTAAKVCHEGGFRNLRKSATTAAAVAGASEVTIEMLLGHASPKMWRRYAGVVPPAVEDAIRKIEEHFFGVAGPQEAAQDGKGATATGEAAASADPQTT